VRKTAKFSGLGAVAAVGLGVVAAVFAQGAPAANPRDLSGVWWVGNPGSDQLLALGRAGDARRCETCHVPEHAEPEPPLTEWAQADPAVRVPAPRLPCEPVGIPAQFWYTQFAPFEIVVTDDRIFQFFEHHREWRTIWLNGSHPPDLEPTYMGHSVGKWQGDTLVIDTIGFNGKTMIEPVGVTHLMSDTFRLTERWRRVSAERVEVELTYADPKVWGNRTWGGLKKSFLLQPHSKLEEAYCSTRDTAAFDHVFVTPFVRPAP
jgi:hypothetical protein